MSVEARLQALVQSYRAQYGDAALMQSQQLIAQLSVQAPDLHGEVKALSAAINRGAAARIASAPDPEAEATKVATEIAAAEKLSMAVVTAAVAVARTLGGLPAAPAMPPVPPAAASGWAGETVVVAPQPPTGGIPQQGAAPGYVPPGSMPPGGSPAPAKPFYKNPLVIGGAIAAVLLLLVWSGQQEVPVTNGQAPQDGPPQPPGQAPILATRAPLPTLTSNRNSDGVVIPFLLQGSSGAAPGVVVLPAGGWDSGPTSVAFGRPGSQGGQIEVMNEGAAQMQRMRGNGGLARAGQVQWQRDGLNIGPICIAFQSAAGQGQQRDVGLSGTTMCVMDGNCQQSIGCGRMR